MAATPSLYLILGWGYLHPHLPSFAAQLAGQRGPDALPGPHGDALLLPRGQHAAPQAHRRQGLAARQLGPLLRRYGYSEAPPA